MRQKLLNLTEPYRGLPREVYIIFISRTINAFGALIFPFLTMILDRKIGLSPAHIGMFTAITGFLYIPSSMLGGYLSDHYGRKRILIVFEFLATIGYGACLFFDMSMMTVYILMGSSFMFGIAGPSHDAIIADLTKGKQRDGAYSLSYFGFNLGFVFAQITGGILFENYIKWMFVIDVITAIIGISLVAIFIEETHKGINQEGNSEVDSLEKSETGSIIDVLLKRPLLLGFAVASFGYKFAYSQWSFMIPLHISRNFGSESGVLWGYLGAFNGVIVVLFTLVLTSLFSKYTNIRKIFYAGILFTVGFGMLGFVDFKAAFFISVFIFTLGEILEAISAMPYIMAHTPESHRGRMSSVLPIIFGTGYSLGPWVTGMITERTSIETAWMVVGVVVLISTVMMKYLEKIDNKAREDLFYECLNEER